MALVPFKSRGGFADANRVILSGAGTPAGAAADAAGVGSEWTDTTTGHKYTKHTAGAGAANWERFVRVSEVAQLASGSWREPVDVLDTASPDPATILTSMDANNTIDGVNVYAGMRILFTAFTAPNNANVYIVGGVAGAWTLTEDTNAATAGDVVRVTSGTAAGQAWQYIGGAWQYVDAYLNTEDQFIRAFIGKAAAGNSMPAYTSTTYVAAGDSLETAIGKLDAQLTTEAARITSVENINTSQQNEIDTIEASAGLNADGTLPAFTGTSFLTGVGSLYAAITTLDAQLNTEITNRTNAISALQAELDATQAGAGLSVGGAYTANATANYISAATSLANADDLLDAALKVVDNNVTALQADVGNINAYSSTNYIAQGDSVVVAIGKLDAALQSLAASGNVVNFTTTILDSFAVDGFDIAEWLLVFSDNAAPQNKLGMKVIAMHDGTATADAVGVDDTEFAQLELGTPPNVSVSVNLNGVGAAQQVQLSVSAPAAINAKFRRVAI